jgi:hypothetical protein
MKPSEHIKLIQSCLEKIGRAETPEWLRIESMKNAKMSAESLATMAEAMDGKLDEFLADDVPGATRIDEYI